MPVEYVPSAMPLDEESEILVKVAWSDQHVEVGVICRETHTHTTIELPEGQGFDSWYSTLDRRGINQLIKNLRKARDRAYGRDE